MNKHTDGDSPAEIAALRQRLSKLEAEHRELKRQATRTRLPAFSRTFLLCALPVALVLATAGLLYGVDALFIDKDGNVRIGGAVGINRDAISSQQLVIQPKQGNAPFNVTDPAGNMNWLSVFSDGKVIMNGGNVGIGKTNPSTKLDVDGTLNATGNSTLKDTTINGGLTVTGNGNSSFTGNVGIGTNQPQAKLDIQNEPRTLPDNHTSATHGVFYVTGNMKPESGIEFRHSNGTQGIGFGYNTIYATGALTNQDLNILARGTGKVNIVQQDWQPVAKQETPERIGIVAFQNSWQNYSKINPAGWNDAGYFKDSMGIVHLKGVVSGGGVGEGNSAIFTLPAGYRSIGREILVCAAGSGSGAGRVDVRTNGEVTVQAGGNSWVSLDGLTFRAGSK